MACERSGYVECIEWDINAVLTVRGKGPRTQISTANEREAYGFI